MWLNPLQVIHDNPNYDKTLKLDPNGGITDEMLSGCNPTFRDDNVNNGAENNCTKNTFALEMRKRGYDVSAGRSFSGANYNCQTSWWKDAPNPTICTSDENSSALDKFKDAIDSYGNGTSGEIRVALGKGTGRDWGHSMHWTVDNDGKFEIQDGQENKRYSSVEDFWNQCPIAYRDTLNVTRLDNCEPNFDNAASDSCIRENPRNKNVRESGYENSGYNNGKFNYDVIDDSWVRSTGRHEDQTGVYRPEDYAVGNANATGQSISNVYKTILDNYGDEPFDSIEDYDAYFDQY